jgi:hypothetical protein
MFFSVTHYVAVSETTNTSKQPDLPATPSNVTQRSINDHLQKASTNNERRNSSTTNRGS